ncbi:LD-carboxypeptidase [Niabella ginsenosidivorans]|uniref:LD-carboxypeptidase n=1 Tax=Niabella ginsenosidivorans TaxID=1176587 RepID=A0A1A9HZT3_9BACT|nr:LD-carboxypeptidase [Niabella ginsenosidivorans]ANH79932.1 LD-carboxypeptidase [Niabella ginsenosidivorans]
MNRKTFVQSSLAALTAAGLPASMAYAGAQKQVDISGEIPPFLKPGDLIGITSPAGYITREEILPAAALMQQWGFKIRAGYTIGKRDFTFGGTDAERLDDLQKMLDDADVKAIMCARGGYGSVRIVDGLKWDQFRQRPKWVIGFSDITVLHSHIHRNFGIATIHSKMCNSFPDVWETADPLQKDTIESIRKALTGEKMMYSAEAFNSVNKPGTATGILVGGNLKTLETLAGSASDIHTDGKILFVEDTGEYMYSIDRMLWNLKRTGKLAKLAGLIVGGMKLKQDPLDEQFGKNIYDSVLEKTKEYSYPVCFDFPVGHQIDNYAYRCGTRHQLNVTIKTATLNSL